jgi:hypothetical protein
MDDRAAGAASAEDPNDLSSTTTGGRSDGLLARRDFTRNAALAAGLVWTAPKISRINFSGQVTVGSPPRETTTSTTVEEETSTSSTTGTTIHHEGSTTTSTSRPPNETTTSTTGPPGTTGPTTPTTVGPNGSASTTVVAQETSTSAVTPTTKGTTTGPIDGIGGGSGGGGKGPLSFTGADTADLLIASAAALATGRTLFWLAARRGEQDEDVPIPPPAG